MRSYEKIVPFLAIIMLAIPLLQSASAVGSRGGVKIDSPVVDVVVDNSFVRVTTSVTLTNTNDGTSEYVYRFNIPEDAFLTNLTAEMGGLTYYGRVKVDQEAQQEYDDAVEAGKSAIKIEKYSVSSFGMTLNLLENKPMDVSFTYHQYLVKELGGYRLALDPGELLPSLSTIDTSVSIRVTSPTVITDAGVSKLGDDKVEYDGLYSAECSAAVPPGNLDNEIVFNYETAGTGKEGTMRFHDDGEITYFLHTFAPAQEELGEDPLQKDIVFVVDTSGSMSGDKMTQTKEAFHYIVGELSEEYDRFNIISFSSNPQRWKEELQTPSGSVVDEANGWIDGLSATGGTNIIDALDRGLEVFDDDSSRMKIIVFLTDGNPTAGTPTAPNAICSQIYDQNTAKISIFSLGIGNDVDFSFLEKLSFINYARAQKIETGLDISEQIGHFYDTISTPLIFRLNLEYENAGSVYHRNAPYLFKGQEHLVLGKVDDTTKDVVFAGTGVTVNGSTSLRGSFEAGNDENPFVAQLWAFMHIRWCQEQIAKGEKAKTGNATSGYTYEEEITHTAVEHQIVTEYTTMIVVVEEPEEPPAETDDDADDSGENGEKTTGDEIPDDWEQANGMDPDDDSLAYSDSPEDGAGAGGYERWDDDEGDPFIDHYPAGNASTNGGGDASTISEKASSSMLLIFVAGVVVIVIFMIFAVFAVVQSRRQRDRAMKGMRRDIYEYIKVNPGEHLSQIMHEFDMSPSSTTYHLGVLEKSGSVLSHKGSKYKRYYANVDGVFGGDLRDAIGGQEYKQVVSVLKSGTTRKIVNHILLNPGCTQQDIAKEVGINASTVNWHIKKLRRSDLVNLTKKGKFNCYNVKDSETMEKTMEVLGGKNT